MRNNVHFALIGMILLGIADSASSTSVPYFSFDQLVDESEHVVMGVVSDISAKKFKDNIYTTVTLKDSSIVNENGRAQTRRPVKIRFFGGEVNVVERGKTVGIERMVMDGTPDLAIGDEVLVFLKGNGVANMPIFGWGQGLFKIDEYGDVQDANGTPVVGLAGGDVLLSTEEGVRPRKELLRGEQTESSTDGDASENANEPPDEPTLVSTDSVDTRLSEALGNGAAQTLQGNVSNADYAPMPADDFVSLIQERMFVAKASSSVSRVGSVAALFDLPGIKENAADTGLDPLETDTVPQKADTGQEYDLVEPVQKPSRSVGN